MANLPIRLYKTYPIYAGLDMRAINSSILAITLAAMGLGLGLTRLIPRTPSGNASSPTQWATCYSIFFANPNPHHSHKHHNKTQNAYCLDSALGSDFSLASAPATPEGLEK